MTTPRRWYRSLLVAALVVLGLVVGLVLGQTAAVAAPFGARDPDCHLATWVHGAVENRTDGTMVLAQDSLGATNDWCREPGGDIRARATGSWRAGDDSGDTSVLLVYLLSTGDRVALQARMPRGGPPSVDCRFTDVPHPPVRYVCSAEVAMGTADFAFVKFTVRPFGT